MKMHLLSKRICGYSNRRARKWLPMFVAFAEIPVQVRLAQPTVTHSDLIHKDLVIFIVGDGKKT